MRRLEEASGPMCGPPALPNVRVARRGVDVRGAERAAIGFGAHQGLKIAGAVIIAVLVIVVGREGL